LTKVKRLLLQHLTATQLGPHDILLCIWTPKK